MNFDLVRAGKVLFTLAGDIDIEQAAINKKMPKLDSV